MFGEGHWYIFTLLFHRDSPDVHSVCVRKQEHNMKIPFQKWKTNMLMKYESFSKITEIVLRHWKGGCKTSRTRILGSLGNSRILRRGRHDGSRSSHSRSHSSIQLQEIKTGASTVAESLFFKKTAPTQYKVQNLQNSRSERCDFNSQRKLLSAYIRLMICPKKEKNTYFD